MHRLVVTAASVSLLSGCFTEIRASSRAFLTSDDSQLTISASVAESERAVVQVLSRRGFLVFDEQLSTDGTVRLTFKSDATKTFAAQRNRFVDSEVADTVGSVLYAHFEQVGERTVVTFLGKPTLGGQPVCSAQDEAFRVGCKTTTRPQWWSGLAAVTGREEAEAIQGARLHLKLEWPEVVLGNTTLTASSRGCGPAGAPWVYPSADQGPCPTVAP